MFPIRRYWPEERRGPPRRFVWVILVADDTSVTQLDVAAGIVCDIGIVSHEDDRASLGIEFLKEHEDLKRRTGIKITRCLISENHGRIVDQRAGDGHTLHLTTRHLVGLVIESVAQSHSLQGFYRPTETFLGRHIGIVHQRQLHVLHRCRLWQQIIVLKDKTYLAVAQHSTLAFRHCAHGDAIEEIVAARGRVETAELVEKRGLSGTGLTHDGDKLTFIDLERHPTQRVHGFVADQEVTLHIAQLNDDFAIVAIAVIMIIVVHCGFSVLLNQSSFNIEHSTLLSFIIQH